MKIIIVMAALLLSPLVQAAPAPAAGELNATDGPLSFSGGPFVVPNPSSDTLYVGEEVDTPVVCEATLMNCDVYALTVAIPDAYRSAEENRKDVVRAVVVFSPAQPGSDTVDLTAFEAYLHDASGAEIAKSEYDFTGLDNSAGFELPLSEVPDGVYEVRVTANRGLAGTYQAELSLVKPASDKSNAPAFGGALTSGLLLGLWGLAATRRRGSRRLS